jgi:DNA polymerase-1
MQPTSEAFISQEERGCEFASAPSAAPSAAFAMVDPSDLEVDDHDTDSSSDADGADANSHSEPAQYGESELDGVTVVYVADAAEAEALIDEMVADAGKSPVALDLEIAPTESETARLIALEADRKAVMARRAADPVVKTAMQERASDPARRAEMSARTAHRKALRQEGRPDEEIEILLEPFDERIDELTKPFEQKIAEAEKPFDREIALIEKAIKHVEEAWKDSNRSRIRLAQLYGGGKRCAVIDLFAAGEAVLKRLNGAGIVAHNATFDTAHLRRAGVEPGRIDCTVQASRLVAGRKRLKLAQVVKLHLKHDLAKDEQASDWSAPALSQAQIEYAARDAVWLWRACEPIYRAVRQQASAYRVQCSAIKAVAGMNLRGVLLDLDAHAKVVKELAAQDAEAREAYQAACREMGRSDLADGRVPQTDAEFVEVVKAIVPEDEIRALDWRRTDKTRELSMSKTELWKALKYPPIGAMIDLRDTQYLLSNFGEGLRCLADRDGRLHPTYTICGTPTGRASCSGPNIQGVSRDPRIRAMFVAKPGYVFVGADYGAMELRAAAYFYRDPVLIDLFARGEDPHWLTALKVNGPSLETADEAAKTVARSKAKAVNFGTLFGIQAEGLARNIWKGSEGKIRISSIEAQRLLDGFAATYPDLIRNRGEFAEWCFVNSCIVIGRNWEQGRGRVIPFSDLEEGDSPERCSFNYPIQGLSADASMGAVAAIHGDLIAAGIDGHLAIWAHDELVLEVREDQAERAAPMLKAAMEKAFLGVFPGASLIKLVDLNIGPNWAAVKEKPTKARGIPAP